MHISTKSQKTISFIIFVCFLFIFTQFASAGRFFTSSPELLTPEDGQITETTVTFSWSKLRGTKSYALQVTNAEESDFEYPVLEVTVDDTQYISYNELSPGSYLWRVKGISKKSKGEWSQTDSFSIETEYTLFFDDFSEYPVDQCMEDGTNFGPWTLVFNGYGCVSIETDGSNNWLHQSPEESTSIYETHASLVTGPYFEGPIFYEVYTKTVEQLRSEDPYPWEVSWVIWNYTDNEHFYYFIPKPNGWELGKRDPDYPGGQRFLSTGAEPVFPIGNEYAVSVEQDKDHTITVYVDGVLITTFKDEESPYSSGRIGLYNEDAHVHFDDASVTQ